MRFLKKSAYFLLDILFPPRCPFCGDALPPGNLVHKSCEEMLPRVTGDRCRKCGKPVWPGEKLCLDCAGTEHSYLAGFGAFVYEGVFRDAVLAMKFRGKKEYARAIGYLTAREALPFLAKYRVELLVPAPMHRKKKRVRGFDQAEELAKHISEYTGIPLATGALVRKEETKAMKELREKERRRNLKGVFSVAKPERIRGRRIALIDDIYTTGATADACAEVLYRSGAACVVVVTSGTGDDR